MQIQECTLINIRKKLYNESAKINFKECDFDNEMYSKDKLLEENQEFTIR